MMPLRIKQLKVSIVKRLAKIFRKMAYKFAYVIFLLYLCSGFKFLPVFGN